MVGDQAAENVTLAVVADPLRRCNTFFPFPCVLRTVFVYTSNFAHPDRLTLRTVMVVVSWLPLFACPGFGWDGDHFLPSSWYSAVLLDLV